METFENTILRSVRIIFEVNETLDEYFSKFQHIEIQDIYDIGKILVIDNELQFAEMDEFMYHEMFYFPALFSHDNPRKILIIGGEISY